MLVSSIRFQVSKFKNPFKSFKSLIQVPIIHSTPLALWRGVGGEAFFPPPRGSRRGAGIGGELLQIDLVSECDLEHTVFGLNQIGDFRQA